MREGKRVLEPYLPHQRVEALHTDSIRIGNKYPVAQYWCNRVLFSVKKCIFADGGIKNELAEK
jgi:hypothetical protein